mmetsp:Transcript_26354/g.105489  ORF Transcript_26354/g.105489 Transcript_26354/m.105489 type:complete len:184 (+) Transcript_26354:1047-1598(+)
MTSVSWGESDDAGATAYATRMAAPRHLFEVRVCAARASENDRIAHASLAGSELLLPHGGVVVPDSDDVLVHRAADFEAATLVVDVPRAARARFSERVLAHAMVHETCAPPPPKPPIALAACVKSYCAPEVVTKYSKAETRKHGGEYTEAPHTQNLSIWRALPFLALVLKRFTVTERGRKRKLS